MVYVEVLEKVLQQRRADFLRRHHGLSSDQPDDTGSLYIYWQRGLRTL